MHMRVVLLFGFACSFLLWTSFAVRVGLNFTSVFACGGSKDGCNLSEPTLWDTGVVPGPTDDVFLDVAFLNASDPIPSEVIFYLASSNLLVGSLSLNGITMNGSIQCLSTVTVASGGLTVHKDLIISEGARIVVQNSSTLVVLQSLNSSSDQELLFAGPASVSGAVNLLHQSGTIKSTADLNISGGFFGILHLYGAGTKLISGEACTFVEISAAAPFSLSCNTSTAYNLVVEKLASAALIVGDFRVAPDPEAKGPSGSAAFYAPVSFVGQFSVLGSANAEFYEPLGIANATVDASDDSYLSFGFTNDLSIVQSFVVRGRAVLALYCPIVLTGLFHMADSATVEVFSGSIIDVESGGQLLMSDSATFSRSFSGHVRVWSNGNFDLIPSAGNYGLLTIPTSLLSGVMTSSARLIIRADLFLDSGSIIAPEIVQENRADGRSVVEVRVSGVGLLAAQFVNISGILEPERGLSFEGDLNLLPRSTFQATVGPGNTSLDVRVPGVLRVDGAFLLIDEVVGIAVGPPQYVEWPLFRLTTQLEWSTTGITDGYYDTVEDRAASGEGITVVVRKILPPAETKALVPVADRASPPSLPPELSPVPPSTQTVPPTSQPISRNSEPLTSSPTYVTPLSRPDSVSEPSLSRQDGVVGVSPAAILIIALVAVGVVGLAVFFVLKRHRDRALLQLAAAPEVPLETQPATSSSAASEPSIELSEA
eukprot:TRINITY_DN660_c0_g1_i1.p1 TRINITY_DN660_c0_g1~~TRINITY_DN660_c0_g1_i1.p1  ORF type:complete len:710 (-),score=73.37 TRINITY_DN660_c0_g1_i1:34-2163(-)